MEREWLIGKVLEMYGQVREMRPLVHMIPNYVTAALCADAISAVGARPLMAQAEEEMKEITPTAGALAVNLGQPSGEKYRACREALYAAAEHGIPVILDPVGAGASEYRRSMAAGLSAIPWSGIIKGNGSELHTILTGAMARDGVDSVGTFTHDAEAETFLQQMKENGRKLVIAETGAVDKIIWKEKSGGKTDMICLKHEAGRPVILVGSGCMAGAVLGAMMAAENRKHGEPDTGTMAVLAAAAVSLVSFCCERQGECGYGTYKAGILDSLGRVEAEEYRGYLERNILREE